MAASTPEAKNTGLWERAQLSLMLGVVAVHLVGISGVIYVSAKGHERRMQGLGVDKVRDSIEALAVSVGLAFENRGRLAEVLQSFNHSGAWDGVRVINSDGQIWASLSEHELDTRHRHAGVLTSQWPAGCEVSWEDRDNELLERVVFRAPVPGNERRALLEGVARTSRLIPAGSSIGLGVLAVSTLFSAAMVLMCLLARRHFRTLTRIGSHLVRHKHHLRQEISSLRLAAEGGAVAKSWNQLIRMFEDMRDALGQAHADHELSNALERGASLAFIRAADQLPEGLVHIVNRNRISYINPMACRLLGVVHADAGGGRLILDRIQASGFGKKALEAIQAACNGDRSALTNTLEGDDGSTYRLRIMPVGGARPCNEAVVRIRDISQQAIAEKAREAFVGQVAHELRTPLTNIRAYAETYAEFDDPEVQAECFNVITKETRRLSRLVEEMLSRAQLDLGEMNIRCDDVDLMTLLQEAVRDLRATAENKDLTLEARLPSKLPPLQADRDKIAVVINNLLGNAVKYTERGSVTVQVEVAGERVRIMISDTGIGIPESELPRIFERGHRVNSPAVLRQQGTGIGLTTAQEIVHAHGGTLEVQSREGSGTTFTVDIPLLLKGRMVEQR